MHTALKKLGTPEQEKQKRKINYHVAKKRLEMMKKQAYKKIPSVGVMDIF